MLTLDFIKFAAGEIVDEGVSFCSIIEERWEDVVGIFLETFHCPLHKTVVVEDFLQVVINVQKFTIADEGEKYP